MVFFEELSGNGEDHLIISGDGKEITMRIYQPLTGQYAIPWPVPTSVSSSHILTRKDPKDPDRRLFLLSPRHTVPSSDQESFACLGRRIISGEVRWGNLLKVYGESCFLHLYWEWLEDVLGRSRGILKDAHLYDAVYASLFSYDRNSDIIRSFYEAWCPHTNSLHSSFGEMSISLWDLYMLRGLPITGDIYDEAVPPRDELISKNNNVMQCCRYLFHAFHSLHSEDGKNAGVRIEDWISFWFKGES